MEAVQANSALSPKPFIWTFCACHCELSTRDRCRAGLSNNAARRSDYLFFDQFRTIYDEMILNFALCIAAIVVICVLLLHRMSVVLLTGMLITMIDIDLVGSIHFWGLEVNSITIINLIMAIGLVVDYSAHVIHNFGLQ